MEHTHRKRLNLGMGLLKELIEDTQVEDVDIISALNESLGLATGKSRGAMAKGLQGVRSYISKNPVKAALAASLAIDTYANFKRNNRNMIRLFAKDPYERRMMTDMVKMLTDSGKYKVKKSKYVSGGKSWILVRTSGAR